MAVVFYYLKNDQINRILEQGIQFEDVEIDWIPINGEEKQYITGLLSPKDDVEKYENQEYTCLEIEVQNNYCYVINSDYDCLDNKQIYYDSIIAINDYKFGSYRKPLVIITSSISAKDIHVPNKAMGAPVLFDNSVNLYKDGVYEYLRLKYNDFDETLLAIFFMLMRNKGKYTILGIKKEGSKNVYIYKENSTGKIYSIDAKEGSSNG